MLERARGAQCTDPSVCRNTFQCGNRDAAYRAGHLCRGFPHYNGLYPLTKFDGWMDDAELYRCVGQRNTTFGMYCSTWDFTETNKYATKEGTCRCASVADLAGTNYCSNWLCTKKSTEICGAFSANEFQCGRSCCYYDTSDDDTDDRRMSTNVTGELELSQGANTSATAASRRLLDRCDDIDLVCRPIDVENSLITCACTATATRPNLVSGQPDIEFCINWDCRETDGVRDS